MANIITKVEKGRGCGYRKGGGLYFIADGMGGDCGKLPIPLTVCPCCHAGIKPARGFTWISSLLFANATCSSDNRNCIACPMNLKDEKMGLLWIGEKFYSTPDKFTREAFTQGVSRRVSQIPRDFEIGKTWIALAHRNACSSIGEGGKIEMTAGIFHAFKPNRIEYVVKGDETEEQLDRLEKRGFILVKVIRDVDAAKLEFK